MAKKIFETHKTPMTPAEWLTSMTFPFEINAWKSVKKERMLFLIIQMSHTVSHTQINKKAPCNKGRFKRIFFDFI